MFKKLIKSHAMRRRVSWAIAAILILPFIIFFHATRQDTQRGTGGAAGVLFGKPIPWATFQEQRAWLARQLKNQFGELPDSLNPMLTQYTWDRLLLLEEAKRQRLHVTDTELADTIQRISAFQEQDRFMPERYRRLLQAMGTFPEAFERMLRNDLLIERVVDRIKTSVSVTEEDVQAAYTQEHEQLKALLMLVKPSTFLDRVTATEDELRAFYDTHPDDWRILEQLVVEYAGATREELASRVQLSDDALKAFYEDHRDRFTKPDGVLAPLADVADSVKQQLTDEQVRKQLKALALDLEEDLEDGRPFEEIVRSRAISTHTVGPLSADAAGPQMIDPALLQSVRTLQEAAVGKVVETTQGTFLARLVQRIPSHLPAFDDVRTRVEERVTATRAQEAARAAAHALHDRLTSRTASGMRFEEAFLLEDPLPAVRTLPFTRTQPIDSLGVVPMVNDAAFRTPLGTLSEVIDTPEALVIIRPEERLPVDAAGLVPAATALREQVLAQKQNARLTQWLEDLRQRAHLESFVESASEESG